jgi:hypothetical protein
MPNPKNTSPIPPALPPDDEVPRQPLWETLAMGAAFVLLWFWFAAHKSAQVANVEIAREWTGALLFALGVMAFITVRRVLRLKRAFDEAKQQARGGPSPFPWMPPDRNGHN